jgi:hypothetical protein
VALEAGLRADGAPCGKCVCGGQRPLPLPPSPAAPQAQLPSLPEHVQLPNNVLCCVGARVCSGGTSQVPSKPTLCRCTRRSAPPSGPPPLHCRPALTPHPSPPTPSAPNPLPTSFCDVIVNARDRGPPPRSFAGLDTLWRPHLVTGLPDMTFVSLLCQAPRTAAALAKSPRTTAASTAPQVAMTHQGAVSTARPVRLAGTAVQAKVREWRRWLGLPSLDCVVVNDLPRLVYSQGLAPTVPRASGTT